MGQAAASRTKVLDSAQRALDAVESVRSLGNTLAAEQAELKSRLDAAETRTRELEVLLSRAIADRKQGDDANRALATQVDELTRQERIDARQIDGHANVLVNLRMWQSRPLLGRLRWLVLGR